MIGGAQHDRPRWFDSDDRKILFYVASRAHHEDVGGIAPGLMLALGRTIHEEGIIFNNLKLVEGGVFMTDVINIQTPTGGGVGACGQRRAKGCNKPVSGRAGPTGIKP